MPAGAPFAWEDWGTGRYVMALDENLARRLFPQLSPDEVVGHTVSTETARWNIVAVVSSDPLTKLNPGLKAYGVGYVPTPRRRKAPATPGCPEGSGESGR